MLKNIKIATKVFMGFGIVLALLLILSVVGGMNLNSTGDYFSGYRDTAEIRNLIDRAMIAVQRVRVNARNFVLKPTEANAKQALDSLGLLTKATGETKTQAEKNRKDILPQIANMEGWAKEWTVNFNTLIEKQNKITDITANTLDKLGPDIEKAVTGMMTNAVKIGNADAAYKMAEFGQNLMRSRMFMQRFLRTGEAEAIAMIRDNLNEMRDDIAKLMPELKIEENKVILRKIEDMRKAYLAAAEEIFKLAAERDDIVNVKNQKLGEDMVKTSDEITATLREFQDNLGQTAAAAISNALATIITVAGVALAIGALAAWFIGMGVARPVQGMTKAMAELANKNMQVHIPGFDHKDEIGDMAAAVQVFKDNMIKNDQMAAEQAREQEARTRRATNVDNLTKGFDQTATSVLNTVASASTELEATAARMSSTAEETSKQATAVSAAAEQASTNVQTVASAAEELSSSISEISRQVNKSTDIAKRAVKEADQTHTQVQGLAAAAKKIGEVVSLITDIAEQTNLLALNATIEAARAGEAGKGFAVVASEVKNLATQTAKATDEIGAQINGIQRETQQAVTAIDGIGKIINEINDISTAIASAVEEQGAATQEIARNVEQASQGTSEVTSNISGVNQAASETGSAAVNVLEASRDLAKQGEQLREIVQKFLADVRAA